MVACERTAAECTLRGKIGCISEDMSRLSASVTFCRCKYLPYQSLEISIQPLSVTSDLIGHLQIHRAWIQHDERYLVAAHAHTHMHLDIRHMLLGLETSFAAAR